MCAHACARVGVTVRRPKSDPLAQAGALGSLQPLGKGKGSKVDMQPTARPDRPARAQPQGLVGRLLGPRLLGGPLSGEIGSVGAEASFPPTRKAGLLLSNCAALADVGPGEESEDGRAWRCQKLGDSPVRAASGAPGGHRAGAAGALRQVWAGKRGSGASHTRSAAPRPGPGRAGLPAATLSQRPAELRVAGSRRL